LGLCSSVGNGDWQTPSSISPCSGVPAFIASLAAYGLGIFLVFGGFLFLPQYLQLVLGLSPLQAGLWTLPWALTFVVGSQLTPRRVRRLRPGYLMAGGLALATLGFGVVHPGRRGIAIVTGSVVFSLGTAPVFTLRNDLIIGSAPPERAGATAGISETAAEPGGAVGIAVFGSIGTAIYRSGIADGIPAAVPHQVAEAARDTLGGCHRDRRSAPRSARHPADRDGSGSLPERNPCRCGHQRHRLARAGPPDGDPSAGREDGLGSRGAGASGARGRGRGRINRRRRSESRAQGSMTGKESSVDTKTAHPKAISISELRSEFRGRVIGPGDAEYDRARTVFYGGIDRRPAVIIRPSDATEVSRLVTLARETGLELAVRSGGHSTAGHSVVDGGIVLDLADMRALDIDPERRTAWAEAGLTSGEFTTTAGAHGLAIGFGDTGSVGIGGITLGGGVGLLVRKQGLTIDDLLAADLVTADGRILRVDGENEPELFWAIRGGGGNFGVATRFQFRLHEVSTIVGGMLFLPATAEVIASFIAEAEAAPDELSTIANVMPAPPMPFVPTEAHGQLVIMALMCYAGPADEGERAIAPFRALATPIADMVRPMPYPEMYLPEDEDYHPTAVGHTMFVDAIDGDVAQTVMKYLQDSDATMRVAQLRVLGGAMARVAPDATAFAHRGSRIMVNVAAFYEGPEDRARREAWVANFAAALHQGDPGRTSTSWATRGRPGSARRTRARPGTG
jgi:FAD binding domain/Major Facilitator Superfamily